LVTGNRHENDLSTPRVRQVAILEVVRSDQLIGAGILRHAGGKNRELLQLRLTAHVGAYANGDDNMKCTWPLAAITLLLCVASPAYTGQLKVDNTTTLTTLFSDDGFEDDTVGMNPNAPTTGTWVKPAQTTSGALVIDDATPGPYDGNNYLRIARNGQPNTAQMDAAFDQALTTGDTMNVVFAFLYESTGSSSVNFQLRSGTTLVGGIYAEPDFSAPNFYTLDGALSNQVNSSLAVTPGTWQTIGIQYTAGSSDLTLTVNGVSELLAGAVTGGDVNSIRFTTAAGGTAYYLDAVSAVPEPSSWTLTAVGLVSLFLCRRRT
jgi:PEP-CTERM motif